MPSWRGIDRKSVVLLYTAVLVASSLAVALAPNFPVFPAGRALVGVAIGGFWSLSTAILARLASGRDLPKAIALLQGGTAFALVIAAPLGSFLGGLIGWRGTFFITVPIGIAALVWQLSSCRGCRRRQPSRLARIFGLLRNRTFAIGMAATGSRLHRPERAVDLSSSVPRRRHGTGSECSVHGASRPWRRRTGWNLRHWLRRSGATSAVLVGLPAALAFLALLLIALGPFARLRIPARHVGIFLDADSGGLEHMDGRGSFPVTWKRQADCRSR